MHPRDCHRLEDIDMAAQFGMPFIRIGTNINELEGTESYFERAKKHGMFVASNLMKSYAVNPVIVKFMENLNYIDKLGRGLPMVCQEAAKLGRQVQFLEQGEEFHVILPLLR